MAGDTDDIKVISKKNAGFPDWLNFDQLRNSGIDYLGNLTGKIWTDYNVHDPGITILEALCYALLDLGYRSSLPSEDLFKKDPADTSAENNFFTSAQILTCNPLTITDYRKLLIDIPGVRNAWLNVAEDITIESICRNQDPASEIALSYNNPCQQFLNGLYHVFIELEDGADPDETIAEVKSALMAHRNLCEDFFDINILCKQKLGVCADIELEKGVDADLVYKKIVEDLRSFFSPAPQFYTLQQLLDRGKTIEDIFAGRPYDIKQSHGFVDMDEFNKIMLQKEIHLSDVYHIIFDVEGVNAVRNISIKNCQGAPCKDNNNWIFKIFENNVPDFSLDCSGFRFSRNGIVIAVDTKKYSEYFKLNFSNDGKALYQIPSPYLDAAIPYGNYRADLADYYSIQNDFPRVYGISEGALPKDVSDSRKAQALQLKGYLLFFDQLLADYLSQLKNIRSLFSFTSPAKKEDRRSYFINQLTTVPDYDKLLRFNTDADGNTILGSPGSIIMVPVDRNNLQDLIDTDNIRQINIRKDLPIYSFPTENQRDIARQSVIQDITFGNYPFQVLSDDHNCWFFYLFTSSPDFAMICQQYYKDEPEVKAIIASTLYIGSNWKNYRSYVNADGNSFSFDMESNQTGYLDYLRLILEDETLYISRREQFLNHLLSRFAEQFTDFALLSFDFLDAKQLATREIAAKERFLSAYPDLSSNRGKAYDYSLNGWNNQHIPGLEKKFKALSGITDWKRKNLCHFEVLEYDEEVVIDLSFSGYDHLLTSKKSFESRALGNSALNALRTVLIKEDNYATAYSAIENAYQASVSDGNTTYMHPESFKTERDAMQAGKDLFTLLSPEPTGSDIIASLYDHNLQLNHAGGSGFRKKKSPIESADEHLNVTAALLMDINDAKQWDPMDASGSEMQVHLIQDEANEKRFLDLNTFKRNFYPSDLKKDTVTYKYSIHDLKKTFLFHSENEFDNEQDAITDCDRFLFLLTNESNYQIAQVNQPVQYLIRIHHGSVLVSSDSAEYDSRASASDACRMISRFVQSQLYILQDTVTPTQWKYRFRLAFPQKSSFIFNSVYEKFGSHEEAFNELKKLTSAESGITISGNNKKEIQIGRGKDIMAITTGQVNKDPSVDALAEAKDYFKLKESVNKLLADPKKDMARYVRPLNANENEIYGYRLVKKDGYHAWYIPPQDPSDAAKIKDSIVAVYGQYQQINTYLEICYGGDNIIPVTDVTTHTIFFHYQVKCRNRFYASGKELVLFESVQGYASPDDAGTAFTANYLDIFTHARIASNYGTYISFDEVYLNNDSQTVASNGPFVFIPKETMEQYGFNNGSARDALIKIVDSYPVRPVKKSSQEYRNYFCCDKDPVKPAVTDCNQIKTETDVYYFVLSDGQTDAWISEHVYAVPGDALDAFYFFLMLLRYKGNYYIDYYDCDCSGRLYIREILAESIRRFDSPAKAWGKEGVEKFICVSQTENAFQTYFDNESCRYTFYTACADAGLIHPCRYDTPEKRDKELSVLLSAAKTYDLNSLFKIGEKEYSLDDFVRFVYDAYKKDNPVGNYRSVCENAIGLAGLITDDSIPVPEFLQKYQGQLQAFSYYFPILKKQINLAGDPVYKYYVEIKFPGSCADELSDDPPCDCDNKMQPDQDCCCIAWTSKCCFDTCDEALRYFYEVVICLRDPRNYTAVFECECGPFGIAFNCRCHEKVKRTGPAAKDAELLSVYNTNNAEVRSDAHCCNEIIARNPQNYTSIKMVCRSVLRAKELINCEGLHVVEHILLRPHCVDGDCNCIIRPCGDNQCRFTWELDKDDPCTKDEKLCFIPGEDPYSFIATVVLPAWPERFRKKENRKLLEDLLYREAPAHVLLRILWLTPQDLCCFETYYKEWNRWLAHKNVCKNDFTLCKLIDFLFYRSFYCFECDDCVPCADTTANDPCQFELAMEKDPNAYLNQLDQVFCWQTIDCNKQIEYIPCGQDKRRQVPTVNDPGTILLEKKEVKTLAVAKKKAAAPKAIEEDENEGDDERKIDLRFTGYRTKAVKIHKESGENSNAAKVEGFLKEHAPEFSEYKNLVDAILTNARPHVKNKHPLNIRQQAELIKLLTWYFLDTQVLYGRNMKEIHDLKPVFSKLEKNKLAPDFKEWKEGVVLKFRPDVDIKTIRKQFK